MNDNGLDDRALRDAARRLGTGAAARIDVEHVAARVVRRLRETPAMRLGWLRIAAAVAVLVGGGFAVRAVIHDNAGSRTEAAYFVADDLNDLSAEELRELLAVLDDTSGLRGVGPAEAASDLTELDAQQLRDVLRTLEG